MPCRHRLWMIILSVFLFSACSSTPERLTATPARATPLPANPSPMVSVAPTLTPARQPTPTHLSPTATVPPTVQVCSPLEGLAVENLPDTVANPFNPPPPGSDDPHQGVDFADLRPGDRIALAGRGVQAVLPGQVAAVIAARFPYGNALLVETPLDELPPAWLGALDLPTPGPTLEPRSALTCPEDFSPGGNPSRRSLYLLYAHMQATPQFTLGESVRCGQAIGAVGDSGNALNPHLHLEARLGPAGVQPGSMAHYDTSASPEEMANYCAWRVSGLFQAFDPLRLLGMAP